MTMLKCWALLAAAAVMAVVGPSHSQTIPCGDLCYDQLADTVLDFEEAVAQESLALAAIDLEDANAYTSFDDAFEEQRDVMAEQQQLLDGFAQRHSRFLATLQSVETSLNHFSNTRLSQAQMLLSQATALQAEVEERVSNIEPALNGLASDVSSAAGLEALGETYRAQTLATLSASASDLARVQAQHPEVNATLSSALSVVQETQKAGSCVQDGLEATTSQHAQLRADLSSLQMRATTATLDRTEAAEEAELLQSRLSNMASEVSSAASDVQQLTEVDADTGTEASRLAAAVSVAEEQVVSPLQGDLTSEQDRLSSAREELRELSSQVSAALTATASLQSAVQQDARHASTAVAQVTTLMSEVSALQSMCDDASNTATQTSTAVSTATQAVGNNTQFLGDASAITTAATEELSAISSLAEETSLEEEELRAERMRVQASLSSAITSSQSVGSRIQDVDSRVSGKESRLALVEAAAAARSTEVDAASAAATSIAARAAEDQTTWCAVRDAALALQVEVDALGSSVASYSQLTQATVSNLSTLASELDNGDMAVATNTGALSTNADAIAARESSVVSLEEHVAASQSAIECLPRICFVEDTAP